MIAKAERCYEVFPMEDLPNGNYPGYWGGYIVKCIIGDRRYEFKMNIGIRTQKAACTVKVVDGNVFVSVTPKNDS